jgi:hypothetical protein
MNNRSLKFTIMFLTVACFYAGLGVGADAKALRWSKLTTAKEKHCLIQLLRASHWAGAPSEEIQELVEAAVIAKANLNPAKPSHIYLFDNIGWCGSAGCGLVIGEHGSEGCHLLYDGYGWYTARVLPQRDHGYHRLYLPCEVRFDGQQYQQLREECPNANVPH